MSLWTRLLDAAERQHARRVRKARRAAALAHPLYGRSFAPEPPLPVLQLAEPDGFCEVLCCGGKAKRYLSHRGIHVCQRCDEELAAIDGNVRLARPRVPGALA